MSAGGTTTMGLDWDHENRVLLYVGENGTFAQLPALTRAFAALLLKYFDRRTGALVHGAEDAVAVICRRVGAHMGERRQIRQIIPALVADGFLVAHPGALIIRNWIDAQNPKTEHGTRRVALREELDEQLRKARAQHMAGEEKPTRPVHEPSTSGARVVHEPSTSGARVVHEPSTKDDATSRKDTSQAVLSGPVRSGPTQTGGSDARARPPSPESVGERSLEAFARGSGNRVAVVASPELLGQLGALALSAVPRALTPDDFERLGRAWAAKTALAWCRSPSVALLVANGGRHLFDGLADVAARPAPARPASAGMSQLKRELSGSEDRVPTGIAARIMAKQAAHG